MVLETLILIASGKINIDKKCIRQMATFVLIETYKKKLYSTTLVIYLNNYLPPTYGLL